ncbi:MAG: hypothetical protein N5P05_002795 [Chroococcopsis gigantea SAG 12.99]|jgi:tetratricopeptide (TPR) repeat protein|nr:tetratricopeptide repeat protein [Chlorogloea purpurea SAG 13.99]MDV3001189.1 hypothetical protein [Chroococcopsis gigantea SAG 12.99]
MTQQNSEQPNSNLLAKQNLFDGISALCAFGGVIASAVTQNALAAALPLAGAVGVHIFNRRQLMADVTQHYETMIRQQNLHIVNHQTSLKNLSQQIESLQNGLQNQVTQYHLENQQSLEGQARQLGEINLVIAELKQFDNLSAEKHQQLADKVQQLQKIENVSHALGVHPSSPYMYYQRALSHESLGDVEAAIADYTQAIKCDPQWPTAYHNRGMLYAELGNRKAAVEDLRQAAKFYFDKGDLDNYKVARELFKQYYSIDFINSHALLNEADNNNYQAVLAGNLFDDN